jgi:thiamine-monophosphate kinase
MPSERDLIARHFTRPPRRAGVVLGVGDDAAIVRPERDAELIVSVDTLVEGVHFLPDVDPFALGHRALAVNLSDMAAMGAEPAWATLALTLAGVDDAWLARFAAGFFALADEYRVDLVGGNLARGPLSITVQIHGHAPPGAAFRRDAARPGDAVFVTGTLGDAGLALLLGRTPSRDCAPGALDFLRGRLERPQPRVREALALRGLIHAAIDLSDGLAADLGRVLEASGVGATLRLADLPLSPAFRACLRAVEDSDGLRRRLRGRDAGPAWAELALASGDDYELCFTAPAERRAAVETALAAVGCACVGTIEPRPGLRCLLPDGEPYHGSRGGWDHFGD